MKPLHHRALLARKRWRKAHPHSPVVPNGTVGVLAARGACPRGGDIEWQWEDGKYELFRKWHGDIVVRGEGELL